ncbi:MAG: hypothetical protein ABL921_34150, partial [Pirellula sp.]
MSNPYRWNQLNLDLVYGRKILLDEMLAALPSANGNSFGITGARRMGKTTILRTVEKDLRDGQKIYSESGTCLVPIYVDGLTLQRPLTAEIVWGKIHQELLRAFSPKTLADPSPIDFQDFVDSCSRLFLDAEKVPKVIVIFDEIEHIIVHDEWAPAFFANWRALLSNYPEISGYISAVFSGAREMANLQHDVGSPLMDVLEWRSLRSLGRDETKKLMMEPCGLAISDDAVDRVFEETGGHPMIVQYVMQKTLSFSSTVNVDNLVAAISEFEENRSWQFGEWWNKYCDPDGQLVYQSLPEDHSYKNVSAYANELGGYRASKALEILQHVGIAELSNDRSQVRRRCRMFTRWAKSHAGSASSGDFDTSLASLLERIDQTLREKYVSAWSIYRQNMPNYSGAVSEMRDLITLVLHHVAPNQKVQEQPGFALEPNQATPNRRQRVMYLFRVSGKEQGKAIASEDELLDAHASQLTSVVQKSYANASALTHTTASRPLA